MSERRVRRVGFGPPPSLPNDSKSPTSFSTASPEYWGANALRGLLSRIVAVESQPWRQAGWGAAGIERDDAEAILLESLHAVQAYALLEALDTILGMRWPAPIGTLSDILHEAMTALSLGRRPALAALIEAALEHAHVDQTPTPRAASQTGSIRSWRARSPALGSVQRPSMDRSAAGARFPAPSPSGTRRPSLDSAGAAGGRGSQPASWLWGMAPDDVIRPELRPGSERDKITAAAPPTDLSLRETPWLEFERRRKERAERRKAMRIKTEEERAVEAMAEITRSARGNHGQGQGTADAKEPSDENAEPRADSHSCRVIGQASYFGMPAKYKSGHDHMRARDGRVEEEKKARAERWEAHAGWKDVKGLVRRAGEVGPKPVLLRSFDKKAVIEMRGGAQWHGWLHPKIVQSWGRVAGGFAPVVEFKADEKKAPSSQDAASAYSWLTTNGDSLDVRDVAKQIEGAMDQGSQLNARHAARRQAKECERQIATAIRSAYPAYPTPPTVDDILGEWGVSPLYQRYLELLGSMRESEGLKMSLRASPASVMTGECPGDPDELMLPGGVAVPVLGRSRASSISHLGRPPSRGTYQSRLSQDGRTSAQGGRPGSNRDLLGRLMEVSTTSSEGSSRAADEGRDATPWAGEVREDLEDALEAAWEAYNAAVQGNGGTTGPRGKMTVDEASYFGTVSGRLVRATDANGGFRNTMGRDRVMLEGEPGTAFLRVSVPRGWGPAQVATNKIEAGPMSLAANLRL